MTFSPPPGSRATKLEELKRSHPELYAARHSLLAVGQTLIGGLGIGALLWALVEGFLPRIAIPRPSLPDIPLPPIPRLDIDLPKVPWPTIPLPVLVIPEPILALLRTLELNAAAREWIIPIVIATFVSIYEERKRREREEAQRERRRKSTQKSELNNPLPAITGFSHGDY